VDLEPRRPHRPELAGHVLAEIMRASATSREISTLSTQRAARENARYLIAVLDDLFRIAALALVVVNEFVSVLITGRVECGYKRHCLRFLSGLGLSLHKLQGLVRDQQLDKADYK
jgi:hypothetical protein